MIPPQLFISIMDASSSLREPSIDPRTDYSRIERKPSHKWTIAEHTTLAYLALSYENSWKDLARIFNEYFLSELGSPDRLSSTALTSMYNDMKRGTTGKDAMKLLRTTAFSFVTEPTRVNQDAIEQTATKLGIQLIKRPRGALSTWLKPPKKQRRAKRKAVVLEEDTDFLSEREAAPRTLKKRQHPNPNPRTPDSPNNHGARSHLLTPPATINQQSIPPKRLPLVAYRAFSSQSQGFYSKEQGFCAGAFVDSDVPLPPDPRSQEYIDEAKRVNNLSTLVWCW